MKAIQTIDAKLFNKAVAKINEYNILGYTIKDDNTDFDPFDIIFATDDELKTMPKTISTDGIINEIKADERKDVDERHFAKLEAEKGRLCFRCDGKGRIPAYSHIDNGICFACGGNGRIR